MTLNVFNSFYYLHLFWIIITIFNAFDDQFYYWSLILFIFHIFTNFIPIAESNDWRLKKLLNAWMITIYFEMFWIFFIENKVRFIFKVYTKLYDTSYSYKCGLENNMNLEYILWQTLNKVIYDWRYFSTRNKSSKTKVESKHSNGQKKVQKQEFL